MQRKHALAMDEFGNSVSPGKLNSLIQKRSAYESLTRLKFVAFASFAAGMRRK